MDPITRSPDELEDAAQPPAPAANPAIVDSSAGAAPSDATAEADTPAPSLPIGGTSPAVDPPSPSPAGRQDGRLVPDAMAALHPEGGYIAMRLLSRMQTDLAVLTGDKRPATYDEVDEYLGHALVAEGIAPRGYTAEQAAKWWAMGGSAALRAPATDARSGNALQSGQSSQVAAPSGNSASNPPTASAAGATAGQRDGTIRPPVAGADAIQNGVNPLQAGARTAPGNAGASTTPESGEFGNPPPASTPPAATQPVPAVKTNDGTAHPSTGQNPAPKAQTGASPASAQPAPLFTPLKTHKTATDWVISAHVGKGKITRLSGQDMIATPAMRAAAAANVAMMAVAAGHHEVMAFGYLMPDGSIQVRLVQGKPGDVMYTGHPSGPGTVIFGIHGHPYDSVGMVDDPSKNGDFGDTDALFKRGIPMATVFRGQIGWHEMVKGQLTFTAPTGAFADDQLQSIQTNLNVSQEKFLKPKPKKVK